MTALTLSPGLTPGQLDQLATQWLAEHDPDGHWVSRQYRETHKAHQSLPSWAEGSEGPGDAPDQEESGVDIEDAGILAEIRYGALKDCLMEALIRAKISASKRKIWDLILDGLSQARVAEWLGITDKAVSKALIQSRPRVLWLARAVIRQEQVTSSDRLPMPEPGPIPDMRGATQLGLFDEDEDDGGDA